jgi:hypothetical protein
VTHISYQKLGKHDFRGIPKESQIPLPYLAKYMDIYKHLEYNLLLSSYCILRERILHDSNKNTAKFLHQLNAAHRTNAHTLNI